MEAIALLWDRRVFALGTAVPLCQIMAIADSGLSLLGKYSTFRSRAFSTLWDSLFLSLLERFLPQKPQPAFCLRTMVLPLVNVHHGGTITPKTIYNYSGHFGALLNSHNLSLCTLGLRALDSEPNKLNRLLIKIAIWKLQNELKSLRLLTFRIWCPS